MRKIADPLHVTTADGRLPCSANLYGEASLVSASAGSSFGSTVCVYFVATEGLGFCEHRDVKLCLRCRGSKRYHELSVR